MRWRERTGATRRPTPTSLRSVLATAPPSLLVELVEAFWKRRGFELSRKAKGEHQFVFVNSTDGEPIHLVLVDSTAAATPKHVGRLASMAESFGSGDATVVTGRDYGNAVYAAADDFDVECLADGQLVTFVKRAGLERMVYQHATNAQSNAVADGGATPKRTYELRPPADHPLAVRAGLVGGGGVLTLLAMWGGAATVTAELQTCTSGCTLLWGASFLPLLAMLVGSFAVAVGVFD